MSPCIGQAQRHQQMSAPPPCAIVRVYPQQLLHGTHLRFERIPPVVVEDQVMLQVLLAVFCVQLGAVRIADEAIKAFLCLSVPQA